MLINLHVKNLALIEEADIDFNDHLNILTGETGAGKSILIGSIQSALGSKIPKDMIRQGADSALIELVFHSTSPAVRKKMEEFELPYEDGDIILSRRITNARIINKINDSTITVSRLRELAPLLLDLSGQHDNQLLLKPANHLQILDSYDKEHIKPVRKEIAELYHSYQEICSELRKEEMGEEQRLREIEFLKYEIQEIKDARLQPHEDEELEEQYHKISHTKEILSLCSSAYDDCSEGSGSASSRIGHAFRMIQEAGAYDTNLESLTEQIATIDALINDFNRELSYYMGSMEFDEESFREIEERLNQINHLKAKYGGSIEAIQDYLTKSVASFEKLTNYEEYLEGLKDKQRNIKKKLDIQCEKLHVLREKAALPLAKQIKTALLDLNFIDVQFEIAISRKEEAGADGIDSVCFMISTNPGLPLGPLHEIASGGELSRIMLAIKSILADEEQIETLIFDEIDTGISGRTAQKVSERLHSIAREHQVIAITHLPQIAAMADSHYLIEKTSDKKSTISNISLLSEEQSVEELARMLGGVKITEAVLENAREMKSFARTFHQ
ncbi:MAG: DNA repair protein RecN [Eubacteriales bacterium]|nr:DNA repair protein RecN [Eubacteriales bacterium]